MWNKNFSPMYCRTEWQKQKPTTTRDLLGYDDGLFSINWYSSPGHETNCQQFDGQSQSTDVLTNKDLYSSRKILWYQIMLWDTKIQTFLTWETLTTALVFSKSFRILVSLGDKISYKSKENIQFIPYMQLLCKPVIYFIASSSSNHWTYGNYFTHISLCVIPR